MHPRRSRKTVIAQWVANSETKHSWNIQVVDNVIPAVTMIGAHGHTSRMNAADYQIQEALQDSQTKPITTILTHMVNITVICWPCKQTYKSAPHPTTGFYKHSIGPATHKNFELIFRHAKRFVSVVKTHTRLNKTSHQESVRMHIFGRTFILIVNKHIKFSGMLGKTRAIQGRPALREYLYSTPDSAHSDDQHVWQIVCIHNFESRESIRPHRSKTFCAIPNKHD